MCSYQICRSRTKCSSKDDTRWEYLAPASRRQYWVLVWGSHVAAAGVWLVHTLFCERVLGRWAVWGSGKRESTDPYSGRGAWCTCLSTSPLLVTSDETSLCSSEVSLVSDTQWDHDVCHMRYHVTSVLLRWSTPNGAGPWERAWLGAEHSLTLMLTPPGCPAFSSTLTLTTELAFGSPGKGQRPTPGVLLQTSHTSTGLGPHRGFEGPSDLIIH